ncbi:MAG: hypothetical protein AB8B61_03900 [Cyclobacteriaceae bacterium]
MKNVIFIKLLFLLSLSISFSASISNELEGIEVKVYTQGDGLSYKRVLDVVQDEKGFIWIATHYGLNKFDGHTFTQFHPEKNNPNTPLSNDINALVFDEKGILYMSQYNTGLSSLNLKTGEFTHLVTLDKLHGLPKKALSTYRIEFANNRVWLSGANGVYSYHTKTKEINYYSKATYDKDNSILVDLTPKNLEKDLDGNLWARMNAAIFRYDSEKDNFIGYEIREIAKKNSQDMTDKYKITTSGSSVILLKDKTPYLLNFDNQLAQKSNLRGITTWNNTLWESTNGGLFTSTLKKVTYLDLKKYFQIQTDFVFDNTLIDKENNLWISSDFGLVKLTKKESPINYLFTESISDIKYKYISSISQLDSNLLFSINETFYNQGRIINSLSDNSQVTYKSQYKICDDQSSLIWICKNNKVYEYISSTENMRQIKNISPSTLIEFDHYRKLLWVFSGKKK